MQTNLWNTLSKFDNAVYQLVSGCMSDGMTGVMKFITYIGSAWVMIPVSAFFLLAALKNDALFYWGWRIAWNLTLVSLLNTILKTIIQRPRPGLHHLVDVSGFSFPSGHAMISSAFYGYMIYLVVIRLKTRIKYLLAGLLGLLVLAIGVSRIYLGVHYASDVLVGFAAGFAWLILFIRLSEKVGARGSGML
jgi:undecaprenyl-diphosphatase